jgi:hypothetical protein
MASESENTSRVQPYSVVIGIWNRPADARGPKVISATRQPQTMIASGVRQNGTGAAEDGVAADIKASEVIVLSGQTARHGAGHDSSAAVAAKSCLVNHAIHARHGGPKPPP